MKNTDLIKQIRTENLTLSKEILDWSEYLILMLSARNCKGHTTTLSSYMSARALMPEVLKFASFAGTPAPLGLESAKELKELLLKYGLITRTYGVDFRGEIHPIDEDELPFYFEALERVNEAHQKHINGDLTKDEYEAVLDDNENKAINPITGGFLPLNSFVTTDYFTGLIEADTRFAVIKDNHMVKAVYKSLTTEQIKEIEVKAKEIAEKEMIDSRQ